MANKEPTKQDAKSRTLADVRALARVLRQYDLSELEVEREGERIKLSRVNGVVQAQQPVVQEAAAQASAEAEKNSKKNDEGELISSPFVGTFYRAPSPKSSPFVQVGQSVSTGATLCIVEAMKLMNEIEAEMDCKILEILVKNGEPVEFGQALFRVEPA